MTAVAHTAGWGLWVLVALSALFAWHTVLVDALVGRRVRFINSASAVVLTWLASWFLILDQLNKLHLLWILPTVLVALDLLQPVRLRRAAYPAAVAGGRTRGGDETATVPDGRPATATEEPKPVTVEQA
jgi:hypothetical protein